ncbi:MAG: tetratricopeptide repeat protein [Aristaeellaceae bacterium]
MEEKNQSVVIPFGMSGARMRRSAQEYRRRGQVLDALSLVRRAAEQEDTASGWQALAAELSQLGCWETAAVLLGRALSREDRAPSVWLDMARCQAALGANALATDCLYHLLHEDPWSSEGDAARAMLAQTEEMQEGREPKRVQRMIQRGIKAWRSGDTALGIRRLKRAVRLSAQKDCLMTAIALLYMKQGEARPALLWMGRALRTAPENPHLLCIMADVLQELGKKRMARGFLRSAMPMCMEIQLEGQFLVTCRGQSAWKEMSAYLDERLRHLPHRTTLLNAKAVMCHERGDVAAAQQLWRQILSIDSGDRRAASLLAWTRRFPRRPLPSLSRLPVILSYAKPCRPLSDSERDALLFRYGSEDRRLLDWFAASTDPLEQKRVLHAVEKQPDRAQEIRFLRELLTRPDTQEPVRHAALIRLANLRCFEPLTVLMGDRYTQVQCQPADEKPTQRPWRIFLPMLLRETRRYGQSMEITHFAAALWPRMNRAQQQDAAGDGGYLWCRAFEVLWLRHTGREDEAVRVVRRMPVSARRVSRLLRRLARCR